METAIDEKRIKELAEDPKILERIANSIAPSVYNLEKIKEAIALQLVSGNKKTEDSAFVECGINILLIGENSCGKSLLLTSISNLLPEIRYLSGKVTSITSLLDQLDENMVCIDDLDKLFVEDMALIENSMAIKGTFILAAANPSLGRFDQYEPIARQIDLPPRLLNRFDLIFPIMDIQNKYQDEQLLDHIFKLHRDPKELKREIPIELLRDYIAYAKQSIKPQLTDEAKEEIKDFYVNLRNKEYKEGITAIPISPSQIKTLIKLSECYARVRLSDKVTRNDAKNAVDLLKYCLMQVAFNPEKPIKEEG